ncbi:MAG: Asp23/Gls24 family envelope stress response protein [Candidatus Onthovivens sp.]|nr:Asp23/Gls24 family envelope stress response protein [Candidatus Onthovivens sp.]
MVASKESNSLDTIDVKVNLKDIANIIGHICDNSYGVVGLTKSKNIKDTIATILNSDNYIEGIFLKKFRNKYIVDVHVVIVYGVKITEVVNELSKHISYVLEKYFGKIFSKINIYVEELRVL